uniref:Uncharacterized protein n=1 Tax=Anguilla anguilla TaxID=7936 RepID=A0A0E9W4R2_ANGAN
MVYFASTVVTSSYTCTKLRSMQNQLLLQCPSYQ